MSEVLVMFDRKEFGLAPTVYFGEITALPQHVEIKKKWKENNLISS